ncbi:MAG: hypothetical protein C4B57_11340 [Deltaproteobacteria bacterium]|nr:MAG: hypothetical protein C4B57_11340 [Deltaproteobacteria bacterium]
MLYRVIIIAIIMSFGELGRTAHAVEVAPRITDREIIQGLAEIKGEIRGIKARLDSVDKRFEQVDKRFEQVDKRFDVMQHNMDNRFDSIEKKIDQLVLLMTSMVGAFAAIVAITIGFAIWDRRTAVRPLQAQIWLLENEKVEKMRKVMLAYAEKNKDWAAVLRSFGLL